MNLKTVVIIGDMLELGKSSTKIHLESCSNIKNHKSKFIINGWENTQRK